MVEFRLPRQALHQRLSRAGFSSTLADVFMKDRFELFERSRIVS